MKIMSHILGVSISWWDGGIIIYMGVHPP